MKKFIVIILLIFGLRLNAMEAERPDRPKGKRLVSKYQEQAKVKVNKDSFKETKRKIKEKMLRFAKEQTAKMAVDTPLSVRRNNPSEQNVVSNAAAAAAAAAQPAVALDQQPDEFSEEALVALVGRLKIDNQFDNEVAKLISKINDFIKYVNDFKHGEYMKNMPESDIKNSMIANMDKMLANSDRMIEIINAMKANKAKTEDIIRKSWELRLQNAELLKQNRALLIQYAESLDLFARRAGAEQYSKIPIRK